MAQVSTGRCNRGSARCLGKGAFGSGHHSHRRVAIFVHLRASPCELVLGLDSRPGGHVLARIHPQAACVNATPTEILCRPRSVGYLDKF